MNTFENDVDPDQPTMPADHNCLGPCSLGAWGGVKNLNFLNMVMWHIKLKGMSSRPGYTEKF